MKQTILTADRLLDFLNSDSRVQPHLDVCVNSKSDRYSVAVRDVSVAVRVLDGGTPVVSLSLEID